MMVVCEDSPNAKCCRQLTAHVRGPQVIGPSVASAPAAHLLDFTPHFSPLVLLPAALGDGPHTGTSPPTYHSSLHDSFVPTLVADRRRTDDGVLRRAAFRTRIIAMLSRLSLGF